MALELVHHPNTEVLEVTLSGKLEKDDYEQFGPWVERVIQQHGKVSILLVLVDFHGWTAGALWEDVKFDAKHFNDIRKLAIVGDKKWEKGMAVFCKPFTTGEVRFFETENLDEARDFVGLSQA